nr:alpha-2-macroglobulin [[Phormidium] sp. ETS-05]
MKIILRNWVKYLLALTLVWGMAGCGNPQANLPAQLPPVAALATPQLPNWIEQISPTGDAEPLAQIRIRFKDPLIPVESLEATEQQGKLKQFEIYPPIPGQFRFLTPRMVGFQAEQAIPKASRIQVTLKAGLADLNNHKLDQDLAWTFNTEPIKLTLPKIKANEYEEAEYIETNPELEFTSNVKLDLSSLKERVQMIATGETTGIPVMVKEKKTADETTPEDEFNPEQRRQTYNFKPEQELKKGTKYRLEFAPGIAPQRGNLPSEVAFTSEVQTYAALQYQGIETFGQPDASGAYGRFAKGAPMLKFNNQLDAESALANITINPKPKEFPTPIRAYDDSNVVSLNPWSLEPATNYNITIGADLKDKYGQTLGQPVQVQYNTGDVGGEIWAPSGIHIFPATDDLELNINAVNLPEGKYKEAYRVVQPTDLVYYDDAYPSSDGDGLLPNPTGWQSSEIKGQKNQTETIKVPLREKLGSETGLLAYGVAARTNTYQEEEQQKWREASYYGMVQLTNLGAFVQWFPDAALIRVNHLSDGAAVAGANVEIYRSQLGAKSRPQPQACATGKTDANGTLALSPDAVQKCNPSDKEAPELVVIARENRDWAFTRIRQYSGAYGYGIYSDWNPGEPLTRGTIFSDRQLYQPGEKAEFTAVAYYLQNGKLVQDKQASYTLSLEAPDGNKTDLGTKTTNDFGTFSLELPLEKNQPLGYYYIRGKSSKGVEITGEFRVAEFKPPNFKVDLNLDKEVAMMGEQVEAKAASSYLFGSPVAGGKVQYYVTRNAADFIPNGWEKFSFGRQWFWPEERPSVTNEVRQEKATLADDGTGSFAVKVDENLPYAMTYRVDAEVTDVSNLAVSNSRSFAALPSDKLIGLKANFVADAGKDFPVEVIVTNPQGQALAGENVRLELQKMNYSQVTRVVEGSSTPSYQVEYKTVAQTQVKSGDKVQTFNLKAPEAGSYRIRASLARGKDEATATDLQIWVTGDSGVMWGRRSDRENFLEIKLDKDTYQPGETATALIQSPYSEGELYFAVVRDKPLYQSVTKVKGGAPQVSFQVTPEMLPNAAVQAVLVRQGAPLEQLEPGSLEDLVKVGFAPFQTSLKDKYLTVAVAPTQEKVEPGTQTTVQLEVKDAAGKPVTGQFTVMVVNEAVLQLTGYRPPDLVKTVYAEQPISTRFSDNRFEVVLAPLSSPLEKGWGFDGGFSAGLGSTRVRTDFQPLAYYNGSVITDANGKATVAFKLPDDLTTWRVLAVATTPDMRFGNGDNTFIASKPVMANPLLPQFVRSGDRFSAGVAITNTTNQEGNLRIQGAVSANMQFDEKSGQNVVSQAKTAPGTSAYRFPITAKSVGEAKVRFVTQVNGGKGDAFEVPLPVKILPVTESVVETGTTTNQVKIPLNLNDKVVPDVGGLQVNLASTLIPEITAPAKAVLDEDDLPFLEPAASQLTIAASLQTLGQKYQQAFADFNPKQQAASAIEKLQKLQQPDGGFGFWPGASASDRLVTPYAAQSLARAKAAGLPVPPEMISKVQAYLSQILAKPSEEKFCTAASCQNRVRLEALLALAELGNQRNDFLADIYAGRDELDAVSRIKLARYMFGFPDWQQQAQTMWSQLQETVYETGRAATVNLPRGWGWLSSPTVAQGETLRLGIARQVAPALRDRLLQALLNQRRNGTWATTYDNAVALTALVDYANTEATPPNFRANVQLGNKNLDSMQFQGYQNPSQFINVAMDQLPKGKSELTLNKSGGGTLHYLVQYDYRLEGNQPGRFNGLRVERQIRDAGEDEVQQTMGISKTDKPMIVKAGRVFDIGLEIIADRPIDRLVISDPLPAGLEAVDTSFQTTNPAVKARSDSWQIGYQTIYKDRVIAYADALDAGVYHLHYLVRSVTPGTYEWPGAEAYLQYAPEEFGRTASATLEVKE